MFESSLISFLKSDTELCSYIGVYQNSPGIFAEYAPESAIRPYITFDISLITTDHLVVDHFNLNFDFWDYNLSRINARKAAERILELLDTYIMSSERYETIRFYRSSGSLVPEDDIRTVHYNLQMTARGSRKKWMSQI